MSIVFVLFGLAVLYLWLRGWWFAGLLVFLAYALGGTQEWGSHSWLAGLVIGFAPWLLWKLLSPSGRRVIADAVRAQEAQAAAERERRRPHKKWMALPRAERARRNAAWRAAHAAAQLS